MPTPLYQGLSRTAYAGDGVTTTWNFDFAGGYLDASHVKAYTETPEGGVTFLGVLPIVGPFQVSVAPAIPRGTVLCIYRDTPKDAPIVNFTDGSGLSEIALDTNAKQAIFLAAEASDITSFSPTGVALTAAAEAAASALSSAAIAASAAASAATAAGSAAATAADVTEVNAILDQIALSGATPGTAVTKEFTATGGQTAFTLDFAPISPTSVDVHVNGVYQHRSTYSLAGAVVTLSAGAEAGDVVEISANVLLQLGTTSADVVEYLPVGVGAVPTTVHAQLSKAVLATDHGAVDTGLADCSAQLQSIFDAMPATGGAVDFGNGRYLITDTVAIPKSNVRLYGKGATIINGVGNGPALYFGDGVTRYYGNSVSDLVFTSAAGSAAGQVGVTFKKQGQLKTQNLVFNDHVAQLYRAVLFDDVYQYESTKLEVQNTKEHGIVILNCGDGKFTDCRSDGNAQLGYWLDGCEGHTFVSCFGYNNAASAWRLVSANPAVRSNKNCWFVACVGDTSGSYNWLITDAKDCYFIGSWGSSQASTAVNTFATGFYLGSNQVKNIQFSGGCAYNNNNHGVQIDSTGGAPENVRFASFDFGSTGAALNGNGKSGAGYGLAINGTVNEVRIDGTCSFKNNTSGPYNNTSSGNDVQFTGNPIGFKVKAKGTTTISDGGTIPHGLNVTPTWAEASATYTTELATVTAIDATNITVAIKTPAGGVGTTQQIRWEAEY